jgi:hypothetical protein
MRHLLLAVTMVVVGLGVTLGTASVLQDVAVAWSKSVQGDGFEVTQIAKPEMKPARQSGPSADRLQDSRI